ncbi:MAG: M48 family metalloprotease [Candidatus Eisenbacteria bacterium]
MSRFRNRPLYRLPVLLLAFALFAIGAGCATNPVTGKSEISFVSESQEIAAGRESEASIEQEFGYYQHAGLSSNVTSIGNALAAGSHRPELPWNFRVLDDPTVNAFAAPGGYIYITRGILAHLNSEAQLAGVLGHEIGHVTARHYARAASRQQIAGLGLILGSVLSESVARSADLAQTGLGLLFLKYSRDNENESDRLGVEYSVKSGWDAREMPATYRTLARIGERAGSRIPTYLSTHPDPGAREGTVRALAEAAVGARTNLKINRDAFLRLQDGVMYGVDPKQGYFENNRFYHPELRFIMDFPSGWQKQNSRNAIVAQSGKTAAMQVTLVNAGGLSPAQYVQKLRTDGQIAAANGSNTTIHRHPAWEGRVTVQDKAGNQGSLLLVVLKKDASMFQILGQAADGSAGESSILASARSFQALTDASRLNPVAAKLRVVPAPRAGTLAQVVAALGTQGADLEEIALINGMDVSTTLAQGRLIKTVTPGRMR